MGKVGIADQVQVQAHKKSTKKTSSVVRQRACMCYCVLDMQQTESGTIQLRVLAYPSKHVSTIFAVFICHDAHELRHCI